MSINEESATEKIIEHLKKCRVLYDLSHPHYKNIRIKNKAWDEMAKSLNVEGMDGEHIKKKWKNLRDNYAKHLRSEKTTTGQKASVICRYKKWPWAQQMEPFRPFLRFATTESNISRAGISSDILESTQEESPADSPVTSLEIPNDDNSVTNDYEVEFPVNIVQRTETADIEQLPTPQTSRKRKVTKVTPSSQPTGTEKILSYLQKRSMVAEFDEIDKIFLGYAAAVRKLSVRRQTMIKFSIAKMIMENELEQQQEIPTSSVCNISNSNAHSLSVMSSPEYSYHVPNVPNTETITSQSLSATATWYENFGNSNI